MNRSLCYCFPHAASPPAPNIWQCFLTHTHTPTQAAPYRLVFPADHREPHAAISTLVVRRSRAWHTAAPTATRSFSGEAGYDPRKPSELSLTLHAKVKTSSQRSKSADCPEAQESLDSEWTFCAAPHTHRDKPIITLLWLDPPLSSSRLPPLFPPSPSLPSVRPPPHSLSVHSFKIEVIKTVHRLASNLLLAFFFFGLEFSHGL